jgi:hypothetical protein
VWPARGPTREWQRLPTSGHRVEIAICNLIIRMLQQIDTEPTRCGAHTGLRGPSAPNTSAKDSCLGSKLQSPVRYLSIRAALLS